MNEAEFEELAAKVLMNEATREERSKLAEWLARQPAAQREFEELLAVKGFVREIGAPEPAADRPVRPIPAGRLNELRHAVRRGVRRDPGFRGIWVWLTEVKASVRLLGREMAIPTRLVTASVAAVAVLCLVLLAMLGPSETQLAGDRSSPRSLPFSSSNFVASATGQNAARIESLLSLPRRQFLGAVTLPTFRGGEAIAVYSPRNATVSLQPAIQWRAAPGKTYSVHIEEVSAEPAPPFHLEAAPSSPIEFASVAAWNGRTLKRDTHYLLTIQDSEDPTSRASVPFQVLSEMGGLRPSTPLGSIERARQLLSYDTPCTGDALAELLALTGEPARTEAVLRLKLIALAKLGLRPEYDEVVARLNELSGDPVQ